MLRGRHPHSLAERTCLHLRHGQLLVDGLQLLLQSEILVILSFGESISGLHEERVFGVLRRRAREDFGVGQTGGACVLGNKALVLVLRGIGRRVVATAGGCEGVGSGRHAHIRQVRRLATAHGLEAQGFIRRLLCLLLAARRVRTLTSHSLSFPRTACRSQAHSAPSARSLFACIPFGSWLELSRACLLGVHKRWRLQGQSAQRSLALLVFVAAKASCVCLFLGMFVDEIGGQSSGQVYFVLQLLRLFALG